MSLILDALRRADSERERGAVPGLHAQPVPAPSPEDSPRHVGAQWRWIGVGLAAGLLVALAGTFFSREAPRGTATPAVAAPSTPAPAVAAAPVATPTPAAVPPAIAATAPAPRVEAQQVAEPAPWPAAESRKAPDKSPAAAAPAVLARAQTEPPAKTPAAEPAVKTAAAEPPVYAREQLPENVRAELPQLAVGGSIYSNDAASRSVIINGRIYRENDRLTADLSLEQIKLKAAVLRYKGYRFEVPF